jgi:hypothetical protein
MAGTVGGITRSGSDGSYAYAAIPGREDVPVTRVSFFDALRFANWLQNGQGDGDTETGAYTLLGGTPTPSNPLVQRNAGATVFLPSDAEWYKAAYHDPGSATWFDYPAGSDAPIACAEPTAAADSANCGRLVGGWPGDLTPVGSYPGSPSPNGTFDQGGNAYEWTDGDVGVLENRTLRGGAYLSNPDRLRAVVQEYDDPWSEQAFVGFRVASLSACANGLDDDGDGRADFDPATFASPGDATTPPAGTGDPVCTSPDAPAEDAHCQNGLDDDGDGRVDYDAGLSANGVADPDGADPACARPWRDRETSAGCGLGLELAAPLALLLGRRRRARA